MDHRLACINIITPLAPTCQYPLAEITHKSKIFQISIFHSPLSKPPHLTLVLKQAKAPKDFKVKLSGDGSADFTLRRNILNIGVSPVKNDEFVVSIASKDTDGKQTSHSRDISSAIGAGISYSATDNAINPENNFSLDTGYGADHSASLNGGDTLTLTNQDRAPIINEGTGFHDLRPDRKIRASSITIAASGSDNTVKIADNFTGKVIIKNPAQTKVLLANSEELTLNKKATSLYFNKG